MTDKLSETSIPRLIRDICAEPAARSFYISRLCVVLETTAANGVNLLAATLVDRISTQPQDLDAVCDLLCALGELRLSELAPAATPITNTLLSVVATKTTPPQRKVVDAIISCAIIAGGGAGIAPVLDVLGVCAEWLGSKQSGRAAAAKRRVACTIICAAAEKVPWAFPAAAAGVLLVLVPCLSDPAVATRVEAGQAAKAALAALAAPSAARPDPSGLSSSAGALLRSGSTPVSFAVAAAAALESTSYDTVHGGLLGILAILGVPSAAAALSPELARQFARGALRAAGARRAAVEVRSDACVVLAGLAAADPLALAGQGEVAVELLTRQITAGTVVHATVVPALGELVRALQDEITVETLAGVVAVVEGLMRGSPVFVAEAVPCTANLLSLPLELIRPHIPALIDGVFAAGLSDDLRHCLDVLADRLPAIRHYLRRRLLDHVSFALSGVPLAHSTLPAAPPPPPPPCAAPAPPPVRESAPAPFTPCSRSSRLSSISREPRLSTVPSLGGVDDLGDLTLTPAEPFVPPTATAAAAAADTAAALNVLSDYDFGCYDLNEFVSSVCLSYLSHARPEIRLSAGRALARFCCTPGRPSCVSQLTLVAVCDTSDTVRRGVLEALQHVAPAAVAADSSAVTMLTSALNDQSTVVAVAALRLYAHVATVIPETCNPHLRCLLLQLVGRVATMQQSLGDATLAAEMLVELCEAAPALAAEHASAILALTRPEGADADALLPALLRLIAAVVRADGQSQAVRDHVSTIFALLRRATGEGSSRGARCAGTEALGVMAEYGPPDQDFGELLPALLAYISGDCLPAARETAVGALGALGAIDPTGAGTDAGAGAGAGAGGEGEDTAPPETPSDPAVVLAPQSIDPSPDAFERASRASLRALLTVLRNTRVELQFHLYACNAIIFILAGTRVGASAAAAALDAAVPRIIALVNTHRETGDVQVAAQFVLRLALMLAASPVPTHIPAVVRLLCDILETATDPALAPLTIVAVAAIEELAIAMPAEIAHHTGLIAPRVAGLIGAAAAADAPDEVLLRLVRAVQLLAAQFKDHAHAVIPPLCTAVQSASADLVARCEAATALARIVQLVPVGSMIPRIVHALLVSLERDGAAIPAFANACVTALAHVAHVAGSAYTGFIQPVYRVLNRLNAHHPVYASVVVRILLGTPYDPSLLLPPPPPPRHLAGVASLLLAGAPSTHTEADPDYKPGRRGAVYFFGLEVDVAELLLLGMSEIRGTRTLLRTLQPRAARTAVADPAVAAAAEHARIMNGGYAETAAAVPVDVNAVLRAASIPADAASSSLSEWLSGLVFVLIDECPAPAVRAIGPIARLLPTVSRTMFPVAFATVHGAVPESVRQLLVGAVSAAMHMSDLQIAALQSLLDFTEALEHDPVFLLAGRAPGMVRAPEGARTADDFALDSGLLAALSEKCYAYAKALHHKETQYLQMLRTSSQTVRVTHSANPTGATNTAANYDIDDDADDANNNENPERTDCLESLIAMENQLQQSDAARGLLVNARLVGLGTDAIREGWLEQLHCWPAALALYRQRQTPSGPYTGASTTDVFDSEGDSEGEGEGVNSAAVLGELRCLLALSQDSAILERVSVVEDGLREHDRATAAATAAQAAVRVGDYDMLDYALRLMKPNSYDYHVFHGILALSKNEPDAASTAVRAGRALLAPRIQALISESYDRAYDATVVSQQLTEISEAARVIRLPHNERTPALERLSEVWDARLRRVRRDPIVWRDILSVRQVLIPPRKAAPTHRELARLAATTDPHLAFAVLKPLLDTDADGLGAALQQTIAPSGSADTARLVKARAATAFVSAHSLHHKLVIARGVAWPTGSSQAVALEGSMINILDQRRRFAAQLGGITSPRSATSRVLTGDGQVARIDTALTAAERKCTIDHVRSQPALRTLLRPFAGERCRVSDDPCTELEYVRQTWEAGSHAPALRRLAALACELHGERESAGLLELFDDDGRCVGAEGAEGVSGGAGGDVFMELVRLSELSRGEMNPLGSEDALTDLVNSDYFTTQLSLAAITSSDTSEQTRALAWRAAAASHLSILTALTAELDENTTNNNNQEQEQEQEQEAAGSATENRESTRARAERMLISTIGAFERAISCSTDRSAVTDVLRLFGVWTDRASWPASERAMLTAISALPLHVWLGVIPQIIARLHTTHDSVRRITVEILSRLAQDHPQALLFPLTVAARRTSTRLDTDQVCRSDAHAMLERVAQRHRLLTEQALVVSRELIRVSILWHEIWHEALDEASRLFFEEGDVQGTLRRMRPLHAALKTPQTPSEKAFAAEYGHMLNAAEDAINEYETYHDAGILHRCWQLYHAVFTPLDAESSSSRPVTLDYASPTLLAMRDLELARPDFYEPGAPLVRIASFAPRMVVLSSKQRPRRMEIMGSDGRSHRYLLKGHEDLRQDERVMQLFSLVNMLVSANPALSGRGLRVVRYAAVPLSTHSGLISWVTQTDTLHHLVKLYRESRAFYVDEESRLIFSLLPSYDRVGRVYRLEPFETAMEQTTGDDLHRILWLRAASSEEWLARRLSFTRAVALTSAVGYILGLGDRHPSNIMVHRRTGRVVHIDFGDCFEVAQRRDRYPEAVPFRLTRLLVRGFGAQGVEGDFRATMEAVMNLIREHGSSILAILEAFLHDPLLSWRLQRDAGPNGLRKEAARVVARVRDKLTGKDYPADTVGPRLSVTDQVGRLMRQASSFESLVSAFFGWMPQL